MTIFTVALATVDSGTNVWWIRTLLFAGGVAASTTILPMQAAMYSNIPSADIGHGSAIANTLRQASLSMRVAVITTVVQAGGGQSVSAFHLGFITAAAFALVGAFMRWCFIHDADARSTLGR